VAADISGPLFYVTIYQNITKNESKSFMKTLPALSDTYSALSLMPSVYFMKCRFIYSFIYIVLCLSPVLIAGNVRETNGGNNGTLLSASFLTLINLLKILIRMPNKIL